MQSKEQIKSLLSTDKPTVLKDSKAGNTNSKIIGSIDEFQTSAKTGKILAVIGGGTAALTYLYTQDIGKEYSHVLVLGDRGYWGIAAHRLAQPHHIFAMPHEPSYEFIDPAEHDQTHGILPHQPSSAYVHSHNYQSRLIELEKATVDSLHTQGKEVFIADKERVKRIDRSKDNGHLKIETASGHSFPVDKIIVATGAGPARTLEENLKKGLSSPDAQAKVLNYTDILTPVVEKCKDKTVLVYGGGATAAWAMEVAALTAKPVAWVGRSGFELAIEAGPRVNAIIVNSRSVQLKGSITSISYVHGENGEEGKLLIGVSEKENEPPKYNFTVDYLFNCIGQEPYELGGLPEILSDSLKEEIIPYFDKNHVTGTKESCKLGWSTAKNDLFIIGAAQGTYYNKSKTGPTVPSDSTAPTAEAAPTVSSFLPRSGQVPITIGGVVSSVCALTNYMPISQDPVTGKAIVSSLNVNVMNATQLAVFFTVNYLGVPPEKINKAVEDLIKERSNTDFGLSPKRFEEFLHEHFGSLPNPERCQMMTQKINKPEAIDARAPISAPKITVEEIPTEPKREKVNKIEDNAFLPETVESLKKSQLFGFFNKPHSQKTPSVKKDSFSEAMRFLPRVDENISLPVIVKKSEALASRNKVEETSPSLITVQTI
ncbi:FAD-dependent oxidoreductase [Legionella resiliens]|uniref:NAD(P)/FAD-dependent oxidoreductase n=1 Tax=Legionella resiliens TaxID=2905958 RepID=A0ABS8X6E8_9GAMM|nr:MULTISPECIES: FAD-dependent oxidoreductase [unclassified Legionella]MCE0723735.1 NAD(P)/FAD-dependent oxidoreductase [Legionella sp. 9fVS26]MCE3532887.1 NAD(P)/FAD-dependent oxidoreductase [Legionella sp. 8cVS16]